MLKKTEQGGKAISFPSESQDTFLPLDFNYNISGLCTPELKQIVSIFLDFFFYLRLRLTPTAFLVWRLPGLD